jgi:phenylacetic acid degradation operon negative regulatory protein
MPSPTSARTVARPNSFIYTLMGDLVRYYGGEIWIGSLTQLMGEFGVSDAAVRQAVSRMSRSGWITGRKLGNKSYYAITERGRARVDRVSPRIYQPPETAWDGKWRMLAYTIPEASRDARDRLRKDLAVLGFASLGTALWLSPRDALDAARDAAAANDVLAHVDTFVAQSNGPHDDRDLIARCWDLSSIAATYRAFIDDYGARLEALRRDSPRSDAEAFVDREWLVHDFRKFVYVDPGLPLALLPADWPAVRASAIFRETYEHVRPGSVRFFEAIFKRAPDRPHEPLADHDAFATLLGPEARPF